jgi:hypothetical protein
VTSRRVAGGSAISLITEVLKAQTGQVGNVNVVLKLEKMEAGE